MNNEPVAPITNQRFSGVYALLARSGDGVYVGSSQRIDRRIGTHFNSLQRGIHHASALQAHYDAGEQFDVVILERCLPEQCVEREQHWMDTIGPLLNTSMRAACPSLDKAIAQKIGNANRGRKHPAVGASNKLRTGTPWQPRDREAWLANLSAAKTGQRFGPRDPSVGKKIAAALRGQPMSAERREKISLGHRRFHARMREQGLTQRRPRRIA